MKQAVIGALLLLSPAVAAAILQSAYLPPAVDTARKTVPDKPKPMPAPAPTEHFASPPASPPRWTL